MANSNSANAENLTVEDLALEVRLHSEKPLVNVLWHAMRNELEKVAMQDNFSETPPPFAKMQIRKDSFDGSESFYGEWQVNGNMVGSYIAHANGNAFTEMDVIKPHPTKTKYFIEAATAWGGVKNIHAELRLLEMPK